MQVIIALTWNWRGREALWRARGWRRARLRCFRQGLGGGGNGIISGLMFSRFVALDFRLAAWDFFSLGLEGHKRIISYTFFILFLSLVETRIPEMYFPQYFYF